MWPQPQPQTQNLENEAVEVAVEHESEEDEEEPSPEYERFDQNNSQTEIIINSNEQKFQTVDTDMTEVSKSETIVKPFTSVSGPIYVFNVPSYDGNNFLITTTSTPGVVEIVDAEPPDSQNHINQVLSAQFEDTMNEIEVTCRKVDSDPECKNTGVKPKGVKRKRKIKSDGDDELLVKKPKERKPRRRAVGNRKPETPVPGMCHLCGYLAKSRTAMYYHNLYNHEKNKKYVCSFCNKGFCQGVGLKLHLRTHTGEKPFSCTACDKKFSQQGSLKSHETIHTGEKNFQCDVCHRLFSFRASLIRHQQRAHIQKPKQLFPCPDCNRMFRHPGFLRTHTKLVHMFGSGQTRIKTKPETENTTETETPNREKVKILRRPVIYSCDLCSATFQMQSQLYQHDRTVHSHFRPYACFKCPKRFSDSAEAKAHFLNAHGITVYPLNKTPAGKGENNSEVCKVQTDTRQFPTAKSSISGSARIETIGQNVYIKKIIDGNRNSYREVYRTLGPSSSNLSGGSGSNSGSSSNDTKDLSVPESHLVDTNTILEKPEGRQKMKVLIIRKKTDVSSSNTRPCTFSNLLTLANVSSDTIATATSALNSVSGNLNADEIHKRGNSGLVIDTITIDESPLPSPVSATNATDSVSVTEVSNELRPHDT